ncbi:MAG: hypothetical protein ACPG7F_01680 [Aggregatilineales bacterium]
MNNTLLESARHNTEDVRFALLTGIVFLVTVGFIAGLFGFTYVQDVETLGNLPELIWNFACGRPESNNVTLPLLMTMSILCFASSALMGIARIWLKKSQKHKNEESNLS